MRLRLFVFFLLLCNSADLLGQRTADRQVADQYFSQRDWPEAIDAYQTYLADTTDAVAWFRLGIAAYKTNNHLLARETMERATAAGIPPGQTRYQLAKIDLATGERDRALLRLDSLATSGFAAYLTLLSDEDFAGLRADDAFEEMVVRVRQNTYPCADDEEYHKLDFWLGDWEVFVNGQARAFSRITKGEGDCTLHENYLTGGGYTGRSFNYFDPEDSLYHQIWIDRSGTISRYREKAARPGYLLMETHGSGPLMRMSYTAKGRDTVVQSMAMSQDSGRNWQNVFLGEYRRVPGATVPQRRFPSAREIVERSQRWHDPMSRWASFRDTLIFEEPRLQNPSRSTWIVLDNTTDNFVFERAYGEDLVRYEITPEGCQFLLNGKEDLSEAEIAKHRFSCERGNGYRKYYHYLHGLPMSLNVYDWEVLTAPTLVLFKGEEYWTFSAKVAGASFSEEWDFYFDPTTFALRAAAYEPPNLDRGPGEYLLFSGELKVNGIRFPRVMTWNDKEDGAFLGVDIGFIANL